MTQNNGTLRHLGTEQFTDLMARTLLAAADYLEGLGGYPGGQPADEPERLVQAVAAEILRRGLVPANEGKFRSDTGEAAGSAPREEESCAGEVRVELTGLAMMRQRRTLSVGEPTTLSVIETLARDSAGSHVWDYLGMLDETVEVTVYP